MADRPHMPGGQYVCNVCGKVFDTREELNEHMQTEHQVTPEPMGTPRPGGTTGTPTTQAQ